MAHHLASDVLEPSSAGLTPLGEIVPPTRVVLEERGVSIDGQYSKALREADRDAADLIVNMTGIPGKALFGVAKQKVLDWGIEDPYGEDMEVYRRIRDEIEERVSQLAAEVRGDASESHA